MNYSVSEENYIKAIYHLQGDQHNVTTNELAQELHTRPASVTDMMKKLKNKKLLHYQPYQGFRLSQEGRKVALGIIRRHRLWEYFLAETLQFDWNEVHDIAEEMEHVSSKKLIDKLDAFLGFPRFDPHGDPIPDSVGKMQPVNQLNILKAPLNKVVEVCQVSNQSPDLLDLLKHMNIGIGTRLEIKRKFSFDNSLEIKLSKQSPFTISETLAKNIFVRHAS